MLICRGVSAAAEKRLSVEAHASLATRKQFRVDVGEGELHDETRYGRIGGLAESFLRHRSLPDPLMRVVGMRFTRVRESTSSHGSIFGELIHDLLRRSIGQLDDLVDLRFGDDERRSKP